MQLVTAAVSKILLLNSATGPPSILDPQDGTRSLNVWPSQRYGIVTEATD